MIKLNETPSISAAEYQASVEALVRVAQGYTGASRVAAQVLLSAYNGDNFHVDITELGVLDAKNLAHTLRVIWGRSAQPCLEPHKVIHDGEAVFHALWDNWCRLHVQNRWKSPCFRCSGQGWQWANPDSDVEKIKKICERCKGTGLDAEVKWPGYDAE